jgi:hypothetical protein
VKRQNDLEHDQDHDDEFQELVIEVEVMGVLQRCF